MSVPERPASQEGAGKHHGGAGEPTTDRPGRVRDMPPAGTTPLHSLPSYADPVAENLDPTSPASPEQTLDYQHADDDVEPPGVEPV